MVIIDLTIVYYFIYTLYIKSNIITMKSATINLKTEPELKKRAELFAKRTGMSLSDVINLSLRQTLNNGQIIIQEPLVPNSKTAKRLKAASKDSQSNKNISPKFDNIDDAIAFLKLG